MLSVNLSQVDVLEVTFLSVSEVVPSLAGEGYLSLTSHALLRKAHLSMS
jgi:hypothetical protein